MRNRVIVWYRVPLRHALCRVADLWLPISYLFYQVQEQVPQFLAVVETVGDVEDRLGHILQGDNNRLHYNKVEMKILSYRSN